MGIFKKIKRGFKKLGSSIAKGMRKIGRGVKKGFGKLTKAFGKLGPIGHLAMFFILPGMGNVLTSWMGQFGSKVMSMLPKDFSRILTSVGNGIKSAASKFLTEPLRNVYNTVSGALTNGIDMVTKPFMGPNSEGLATSFQNFVSDTSAKITGTPTEAPVMPDGPEGVEVSTEASKAAAKNLKSIQKASKGISNPTYQYNTETGNYEIFDGNKLEESLVSGKKITPKRTINIDKKPGVFKKVVDGVDNFKTTVAGTDVLGTGVTIGEGAALAKDTTAVVGAYQAFTAEDGVSGSGFNPDAFNIANAMIPQNDPYTISSQDTSFVPAQPQNTLNSAAQSYVDALQIKGPDPISLALNAPGYGYTFEDYVFGPDYAGNT
tara:strand:+ start:261 stop:1388 length:1128 start_codon:yes stop_codon:yes gene_type:complete